MESIFRKAEEGIESLFGGERHSHTHGVSCGDIHPDSHNNNRYQSFAPQSSGHAKWYIDGCSYFWAVSEALEAARDTIYILDWWLSPELYLRRPPSSNELYRLDRMLQAAAERGVQVRVIVYKEVPQALTLDSLHTKHALEALHPNIRVFRHPDHLPNGHDLQADFESAFANLSLGSFDLSKLGTDALKSLYGTSDDVVLFWAHHEKLCVVDSHIVFMGGLDMCFGRWDTNSHPIADAHPENLDDIIFPGQDYNNARVYDFEDVDKWQNNKLDRTKFSRMGWSDISISLSGPIVSSLLIHFVDRWNYIYNQKYISRDEGYQKIDLPFSHAGPGEGMLTQGERFFGGLHRHFHKHMARLLGEEEEEQEEQEERSREPGAGSQACHIQATRSCSEWSSGHKTEHSIANAYIDAITNARHFVYIENQFFITATSDEQRPVANKIGRAIVDRIVRAYQAGEDFAVVVCIPAVPGFAGDLHGKDALGTRAIMEYQYNSISRGGYSIMEELQKAGVPEPRQYINFYNLRNYDRINASDVMGEVEQRAGVSYGAARREFDDAVESGYDGYSPEPTYGRLGDQYQRYQAAAEAEMQQLDRRAGGDGTGSVAIWDTVSACYMANGPDLERIPWRGSPESEMAAFVSEELYIHTKVLVADDRLVICGSANLNDRSQLGTHDSEIAVVIEDPEPVESTMGGRPYVASRFAASFRRQLFRKHLGLLPDQRWDRPNNNWTPVTRGPNEYDWGSPADQLVADPMSADFRALWADTARRNTDVFSDVFHVVPNDRVRNWDDYDAFFSRYFTMPSSGASSNDKDKKKGNGNGDEPQDPATPEEGKVLYGHVVPDYPGGVEAVKQRLAEVRGTLVEMPLDFLVEVEDLAKEGLELNSFTDEIYT